MKDEGLQCSYQSVKSTAWSKGSAETWTVPWSSLMSSKLPSDERLHFAMENHHAINGKIDYKWPFSIAMLKKPEGNMF